MKRQKLILVFIFFSLSSFFSVTNGGEAGRADISEAMKESIVYLNTSFYGYNQHQPWRHRDVKEGWGCACAVGEYEVLTTAWNVADVALIKALRYGQNELRPFPY